MYLPTLKTGVLLTLVGILSCPCMCGKIKMIEEPFSFNSPQAAAGGGHAVVGSNHDKSDNQEAHLELRYLPAKASGPPYLIQHLNGKCFSLTANSYKYELCPFHNITQREQTYRWNAFNGVLGIWKEWLIEGDNFTVMHMIHGDLCAGSIERETTVNLICGPENVMVSVSEPSMCKYKIAFKTPVVCPEDVFFVYPMLSQHGKKRWGEIETEHAENITTDRGYKKHRKQLFINEGLWVDDDLNRNIKFVPNMHDIGANLKPQMMGGLVPASGVFAQDFQSADNRFATKQQCVVEYTKLLSEVEMLRNLLVNHTLNNLQSQLSPPVSPLSPVTAKGTEVQNVLPIGKVNITSDKYQKGDLGVHAKNIIEYKSYLRKVDSSKNNNKKSIIGKKIEGDMGVHVKNVTEHKSYLRKLDSSKEANKKSANRKSSEDITRRNIVQMKSKMKRKGDDGVLDEKSFPMRNLLGRMEYEANVISRLKVHGRLRDMKRKYGEI